MAASALRPRMRDNTCLRQLQEKAKAAWLVATGMLLVILGSRLDTRLNLAIFDRLMTLPFGGTERQPLDRTKCIALSVFG
jgi:hypothetical protein